MINKFELIPRNVSAEGFNHRLGASSNRRKRRETLDRHHTHTHYTHTHTHTTHKQTNTHTGALYINERLCTSDARSRVSMIDFITNVTHDIVNAAVEAVSTCYSAS